MLKMQNLVNLVIFQLKISLNCLIGKIPKFKKLKKIGDVRVLSDAFPSFASNNAEGVSHNTHSAKNIFLKLFYNLKIQNVH